MRKLTALLLILALVIGLVPTAMAKVHTLEIYWIANVNTDKAPKDVAASFGNTGDLADTVDKALDKALAEGR